MQSVLEGIAFRAAEVMETMNGYINPARSISIDGGVSSNRYFCQTLANILNIDIRVKRETELTALGTAHLASNLAGSGFSTKGDKIYHPIQDMRPWLEKYKQAVGRSRAWID